MRGIERITATSRMMTTTDGAGFQAGGERIVGRGVARLGDGQGKAQV